MESFPPISVGKNNASVVVTNNINHQLTSMAPKFHHENIFCWAVEDRFVEGWDVCNCYKCSSERYQEELQREKEEEADRPFVKRPLSPTEKENKAGRTQRWIKKVKKLEAKKTSDDVNSGKQPTLFDFYNPKKKRK
jgi:hypothetical protein